MTQPWTGWYDRGGVSLEDQQGFFNTRQYRSRSGQGPSRLPLVPRFQGEGLTRPDWAPLDSYPYIHFESPSHLPEVIWSSAAWQY